MRLFSNETRPQANFTNVIARAFASGVPTTWAQAGEMAAADIPTENCLGKSNSHGVIKAKISTKAGINALNVPLGTDFLRINK